MIRCLDPNDIDELDKLSELAKRTYAEAFAHSMSTEDLQAHLEQNLGPNSFRGKRILIAGDFLGFAEIGPANYPEVDAKDEDGAIVRMYVDSNNQSKGLGSQLMEAALAEMKDCPRVFLDVWCRNEGAIRLYERFGFTTIGEKRLQLPSGPAEDPDLIMAREQG
jgi:ribosomal protein S18 acetylase RimI-like enzyme